MQDSIDHLTHRVAVTVLPALRDIQRSQRRLMWVVWLAVAASGLGAVLAGIGIMVTLR
jgi:hypothetical protein